MATFVVNCPFCHHTFSVTNPREVPTSFGQLAPSQPEPKFQDGTSTDGPRDKSEWSGCCC